MSLDKNGNVIPKTPAAAVLARATYLQVTQPPEGYPRAEQHRQAILGMGMIGARLGPNETRQPEARRKIWWILVETQNKSMST